MVSGRFAFTESGDSDMATEFILNGERVSTDAAADTMLVWVLREHLKKTGTKFGCGIGRCGSCTVHIDGSARRACRLRLSSIEGREVTTIEGLVANGGQKLVQAWIEEQVPQCGYCQPGQLMRAAALLAENPSPTREEIIDYMDGVLCRCGTYPRILRAIERVIEEG